MNTKKNADEFFIGWSDKYPPNLARFIKKLVLWLFLLVIVVSAVYALSQKKFNPSKSELGVFQAVEGVIYEYPVPMLKVEVGDGDYQSFILVGVGKHSASETMDLIKSKMEPGTKLDDYEVTLNGQAVYYDGKTLLEVPAPENAMDTIQLLDEDEEQWPERMMQDMGMVKLAGEIIDPKCYFGVMNPAYGKIHRSCAIRCISGGIPPVLRIHDDEGVAEYFLILGPDGQAINKEVLDMVGLPVEVKGQLQIVDDWFVLKLDPKNDISLNQAANATSDYVDDVTPKGAK